MILFRDDASFTPFKPLYQGRPANVAGYFQPGEDVNYITISLDSGNRDPYSTAFHEYVHSHVNENIPGAPLWLNEGLAELYGSIQFSTGEALLGVPIAYYVRHLRQQELIPIETFFSIGTGSEHYNESDKSGIFYGQSWALVHYLMLSDRGRPDKFKRFIQLITRGDSTSKAIQDAYGMTLPALEQELKAYIRRGDFQAQRIPLMDNPQAYAAYTAMQRTSLSEGEANFYLGDLLVHIGRPGDAERYFKHAIALEPGFVPPYAALGQLYVQQRKFADAKKLFEKAVASPQPYMTHYLYAYVLSREGVSPSGHIKEYSPANVAVMREQLLRAIKLAPNYAPSYYLLALVDLVADERLDEALEMARRARRLEPSKTSSSLLIAQIHLRRSEDAAARQILEPLTRNSDKSVRDEAQRLLDSIGETSAADRNRSSNAATVSSSMITEPVQSGTSRMLGGETGGTAINDGQTIEKSGSLPTVDEVLSKYVEAIGGAAAINAVTSRVVKGTLDIAGVSRGGSFETYAQAPNKVVTVIQAHPMGTFKVKAEYFGPLSLKNRYKKVTLAGTSKIGYREVYVIDCQPAVGAVDRVYIDAKTFLPARVNSVQTLGRISGPVEIYLDDWRDVDGIKMPFSVSQRFPKLTLSFIVNDVKHNIPVDVKLFEP